jgi:hypothetical protein
MTGNTELIIYNYAPAQNVVLSRSLVGLKNSILDAAQANLDIVLAEDANYTQTEQQAMLLIEQLRQVNGLDLAAVLLRAEYLQQIERTNAIANHPAGYSSLKEMAQDQGMSLAELSQNQDLTNHIFPYILVNLGITVAELWESIVKSNLRELVPVLKAIITGEESGRTSVRNSVNRILNDVAATMAANGENTDDEGEIRRRAVDQLIQDGALLTNRQLRERIRPERIPPIQFDIIHHNGTRMVIAQVNEDQSALLERKMGASIETRNVSLPTDPDLRIQEAYRIPLLRRLLNLVQV